MAGRKTKYTPETVAKLTQAIRMGANNELACDYAGIGHTLFHEWLNTKPEFLEAVKTAKGAAAVGWLAKIEAAANDGTWQAAAWKLERLYPQSYGKQVTEIQGKDGGPILSANVDAAADEFDRRIVDIATRRRTASAARGPVTGGESVEAS